MGMTTAAAIFLVAMASGAPPDTAVTSEVRADTTDVVVPASPPPVDADGIGGADLIGGASAPVADVDAIGPQPRAEDVRLLITGGLSGLQNGLDAFFRAPLFRTGKGLPLKMTDANQVAIISENAIFFSPEAPLDDTLLGSAALAPHQETMERIFEGPAAIAIAPNSGILESTTATTLRREMAAIRQARFSSTAHVARRTVVGVSLDGQPVRWPTATSPRTHVPAAAALWHADGEPQPSRVFLLSRRHASTARTFGELDRLLTASAERTAYVDVGGSLTSSEDTSSSSASAMAALLQARKPSVLGMGRSELVGFSLVPDVMHSAPFLLAADGTDIPATRLVQVGERRVLFVAVGSLGERSIGLLPKGATAHRAEKSIAIAQRQAVETRADAVVAIALSSAGETAALRASIFDVVLHLESAKVGALPSLDLVDLRANHLKGLTAGATLARISPYDVTELGLWLSPGGGVETIRLTRHAVVGEGPEAFDALEAQSHRERAGWRPHDDGEALVARADLGDDVTTWTGRDLTRLLGSIVRERAGVELSIVAVLEEPLPVEGKVPVALARRWLSKNGRMRRTTMKGDQLSKIFAALSTGTLANRFYVNGGSRSAGTVGERPISRLESYSVVFSPELVGALQAAGLSIEADDVEPMPFVSEVIDGALQAGIDADTADRALAHADGVPDHVFIAELADVELSTSLHRIQGNEGFSQVRDSRVLTPNYWAIGINGRATLAYDGPLNYSALVATSQLSRQEQQNGDALVLQEARDMLLFEAESRLLMKRFLDSSPRFTPEPGLRVSFQTEWTPNLVTDEDGVTTEQPRRAELRGFLGITLRPTPLFDEVRAGAIVENDFASVQSGALEWGGEAALRGSYELWRLRVSLESYARGYVPDPANDTPDDLLGVGQAIVRVSLPVVFGLRLGLFADAYVAFGKLAALRGPTTSLILGASLGYGERLKWIPFQPGSF